MQIWPLSNLTTIYARQLNNIANIYGLHQLINEPTRITDKSSSLVGLGPVYMEVGDPRYVRWNMAVYVNVIKLKWEIIWTNGLPHLSGLPHLPGVPHLHVNRPLIYTNSSERVVCSGVAHVGISDQSLVYVYRKLSFDLPKGHTSVTKGLFTWSGEPRSSGVGFFCFHALGTQNKRNLPH